MDSSFGARLRAQRESQQVTLETIADRTKIRLVLLEGLERNDTSLWPTGIFRRSYCRSYAVAIGLDPDQTVREFLSLYPDTIEEPETALAATADERDHRRPPMRLQYLIASAIGALPHALAQMGRKSTPELPDPPIERLPTPAPPSLASFEPELDLIEPSHDERRRPFDEEFVLTAPPAFVDAAPPLHIDLPAMAQLCTRIVEASSVADLERLLEDASHILHAVGLIVWLWDSKRSVLWASLSHGYPAQTLARLPSLARDANNPIGAAFRTANCQVVDSGGSATSAIVAPIMTPGGCAGVLAVECTSGLEQDAAIRALATILAAQLSILVEAQPAAHSATA